MVSPAPGGYVVGIDLGTSNTVAVIRSPDGRRRPVLFDGAPILPSSVFLQDDGHLAVGRDAQRLAQLDPGRYEPNPKRRIDEPAVLLGNVEVPTVQLLAAVLRAAAAGVAEVTRVPPPLVLTYPASWGNTRRGLLHAAATAAGWPHVTLVPEPVAAARYFISTLNHPLPRGESMVVYDFGGGTIDIAVVRNDPHGFTVIGSGGLEDVGGLDLDAALVDLLGGVLQANVPDVWRRLQDPRTAQDRRDRRLFWEDVRGAKEMLSRTTVAPASVPGVEAALHLTREELETRIGPMVARTVTETVRVVRECGLQPAKLAGILLVGGSSRVPLVARMLHRELQVVPTVLEQPELPVAEGAVVHPAELTTGGRIPAATGTARVAAPRPPSGYGTEAVPVSAMPVSGLPMPVSALPVSGGAAVAGPVSPAPFGPPGTPEPTRRRRTALVAGLVALVLLAGAGFWAFKAFTGVAWTALPDLPGDVGLEGTGAAVAGGKLYVIGGLTALEPRNPVNQVHVLDLQTRAWSRGPDLPVAMSHTAVVVDRAGTIWVLGGLTPSGGTDRVWKLDAGAANWADGPALPEARDAGAAVFDGDTIVYGGGTRPDHSPSDKVWALGGTGWTEAGTLSVAREKLAAATDGVGTVWFVGGVKQQAGNVQQDTIDVMLRRRITRSDLKLDHPREGAAAVSLSGIGLCVLGGNNGDTVYGWWCQDGTKTSRLPEQRLPRAGMGVAVSGGTLYTVGGYNGPTHGTRTVEAFRYAG